MSRSLHILTICLCFAALCGCSSGNTSLDSFLQDSNVRLEIDGAKVFIFDENRCQLAFNEQRGVFRANSDTMLDYFELVLERVPDSIGSDVTGSVAWSTIEGENSRKNVTFNVRNIIGDVIWLCDSSQKTAAVVRVLK